MKKTIYFTVFLLLCAGIIALEDTIHFDYANGDTITINRSIISGTNISCNNVVGASYDVCAGGGAVDYSDLQNYSNNPCGAGEYVYDRYQNGTFLCRADQTGSGSYNPDNWTLIFEGGYDKVNMTLINLTIDARASGAGDNASWNETLADSKYLQSYTESDPVYIAGIADYWNQSKVNLGWANLTSYPTACTTAQTITTMGDTLTCSAISITESQISDLSHTVDTTIGNCSVTDSCTNILYYGTKLGNTTQEIFDVCDNSTFEYAGAVVDTNETTRMDNIAGFSCGGSDKVSSFGANGLPVCTADASGGGGGAGVWTSVYGTVEVNTSATGGIDDVNITGELYVEETVGNRTHRYSWAELNATGSSDLSTYWSTSNFTMTNLTQYHTAWSWGDHALAGYSTTGDNSSWNESYADTQYADISVVDTTIGNCSVTDSCDNVVYNGDLGIYWSTSNFSITNLTQYHAAYMWDDHSTQGYITDGNTNWDNSYGFFDNIANFTGTLTSGYHCRYDGTEIDCDVDVSAWDTDASNDVTTEAIANMAQVNETETFAENITFSKNITVTDCIVFGNGAKIGNNC